MSSDLVLCVDLGTGGPKVGLVTEAGEIVAVERHGVETRVSPDGAATQDAAQWWDLVTGSARRMIARVEDAPRRVRAVSVTGQWASTVPVDADGVPTGPCLTYLDTRGGPFVRDRIGGPALGYSPRAVARFIRRTGGAPSMSGADPVGHALYLQNVEPDLLARTRWLMEPVDYLTMRFSGVASATHASRAASWLTDNRRLDRLVYDEELCASLGIDRERLPPLSPFGSLVGPVRDAVASDLGLSRDVVVVTGMPDVHAAALGAGATAPYQAHATLSTTSWISCPVPAKKTDPVHSIASGPGLTNDTYLVLDNQETGGKALEWVRAALAGTGAPAGFDELTALAATSPPGASGVTFAPWLAGERSPSEDKRVRATFASLSVSTTPADLVRAVLEGVAVNSAWLLGHVERFAGRRLEPLRLLGGGAQSPLWCQIYADATQRVVEQVPDPMYAQLRGAAILAEVARGRLSLADVATRTPRGDQFTPHSDLADLYRRRREDLPALFKRERQRARRA